MILKNFDELVSKVQSNNAIRIVAVAAAHDEHTLEAVFKAREDKIVEPLLVGNRDKITKILKGLNLDYDVDKIINTIDDAQSAEIVVKLIKENKADFIMKGKIQTADLLKKVVNKEEGLGTGKVMSHVAIQEIPLYKKLIATTDGGMMMYPNLEEKKQIIENAVGLFKSFGYKNPKIAILAAVEKVNPKMPETVDADLLKKMNLFGDIKDCIVEGPISYDLAISSEAARIKGYESLVAGDADILIVPNITAGNILGKAFTETAGAKMAGIIVGAKVPIVLTSRGATSEEKYLSLALSASVVNKKVL